MTISSIQQLPERTRLLLASLLVAAAVAAAFGPSVRYGFVTLDDNGLVYENPQVQAGLTAQTVAWAFSREQPRPGYFHPLTWLSFMLDRTLLGPEAAGFHLVSVLLHAAAAIVLLLLLARATGRLLPSLVAALLFALHPLQVDAVVWISGRKSVLAGFFAVCAVAAHVAHAARPSWRRLTAVCALQAASLLAKSVAATLPALLLILDVWPLRRLRSEGGPPSPFPRIGLRAALLEKLPVAAVTATIVAVAALDRRPLAPCPFHAPQLTGCEAPLALRMENAIASVPRYLAAAFWPTGFAPTHPFPASIPWAAVALGIATVAILTGLGLWTVRRAPALLAGWTWFLVALSPMVGLRQTGQWASWAERFAYVPLVGLALAVAFGLPALAAATLPGLARGRALRAAWWAAALCAFGALAVATRIQSAYWKDSETILRRTIAVEPLSAVSHMLLGEALLRAQDLPGAAAELQRAVDAQPWYGRAHHELGDLLERAGDLAGAERHFRAATFWEPEIAANPYRLAEVLRATGRSAEAVPLYLHAAALLHERGLEDDARTLLDRAHAPAPQAPVPSASR